MTAKKQQDCSAILYTFHSADLVFDIRSHFTQNAIVRGYYEGMSYNDGS